MAALCSEHHAALDPAVRLMQAHAWVGGGAPAFLTDLTRQRSALQTALSSALHSLAELVVRHGGPAPAVPSLHSSLTVASAAPGGFQGIDPAAMTALVSALDHAGHALAPVGARIAAELSGQGLSGVPGRTIGQVAEWATAQTGDLRRRLTRIRQTVPWDSLPAGVAAFDLFSAHCGDQGGAGALLGRITAGDAGAVRELLAVQERGQDPGLAARVNGWWHALAPELRERLLDLAGFGLLNGLPATVRDAANRRWLAAEKARLTRELGAATAELLRLDDPLLLGHWERVANQLRRVELIERSLRPVPGHPPLLLLAFDLNGLGRLIVSWGDPDTADITVTSVSGLTSGLDAAAGDLERSRALWQQSTAFSGDRTVASITWLGYSAPQLDPGILDPAKSVAFSHAAATGGAGLAAFTDGLRASHVPSGTARAVVIGHSYGSLTTGHAAVLRPGRLADTLIFLGSPGVGVDHVSQLGISPKHVWVGEAGGDPVAALGRFGTDPGRDAFGAQRFPVGREFWTAAHSSYWNQDSPSLRNMGRIINGQYDRLIQPKSYLDQPQLLMPEFSSNSTFKQDR
ncbi:alpha/beta hydrolase [Thermoactinospora rubra]|uniref:alpha/beta hydrolase n=1 Tax=Thermoactinospora rubra TaxID=1088767 RepID=UPI000A11ED88|nr:alpha/beta hydrolase [Thermoactinospora rubra]